MLNTQLVKKIKGLFEKYYTENPDDTSDEKNSEKYQNYIHSREFIGSLSLFFYSNEPTYIENLKRLFEEDWAIVSLSSPTFYIDTHSTPPKTSESTQLMDHKSSAPQQQTPAQTLRTPEAQTLFEIAHIIAEQEFEIRKLNLKLKYDNAIDKDEKEKVLDREEKEKALQDQWENSENLYAYKILIPTLRNPIGTGIDVPDSVADLALITENNPFNSEQPNIYYLVGISHSLVGQSEDDSVTKLYNPYNIHSDLRQDVIEQVKSKQPNLYQRIEDKLSKRRLANEIKPIYLSAKTFAILKLVVELANSTDGSKPDPSIHIKMGILKAMMNDVEFAQYMKKNCPNWLTIKISGNNVDEYKNENFQDPDDNITSVHLLGLIYGYLKEQLEKLPIEEKDALEKIPISTHGESLHSEINKILFNGGCTSKGSQYLAPLVHRNIGFLGTISSLNFLRRIYITRLPLKEKAEEILGNDNLFLEALTGKSYAENFHWYHLFVSYQGNGDKKFPWKRFLFTTLLTLGWMPILTLFSNIANCSKILPRFLQNQIEFLGNFLYFHVYCETPGIPSYLVLGFSRFIGTALEIFIFVLSAIFSPVQTYQKLSAINQYLGYLYIAAMVTFIVTLSVFLPPVLSFILGPKIGGAVIALLTQIAELPIIAQIFAPLGSLLASAIYPFLTALGISVSQSWMAVTMTTIIIPTLWRGMVQFFYDKCLDHPFFPDGGSPKTSGTSPTSTFDAKEVPSFRELHKEHLSNKNNIHYQDQDQDQEEKEYDPSLTNASQTAPPVLVPHQKKFGDLSF